MNAFDRDLQGSYEEAERLAGIGIRSNSNASDVLDVAITLKERIFKDGILQKTPQAMSYIYHAANHPGIGLSQHKDTTAYYEHLLKESPEQFSREFGQELSFVETFIDVAIGQVQGLLQVEKYVEARMAQAEAAAANTDNPETYLANQRAAAIQEGIALLGNTNNVSNLQEQTRKLTEPQQAASPTKGWSLSGFFKPITKAIGTAVKAIGNVFGGMARHKTATASAVAALMLAGSHAKSHSIVSATYDPQVNGERNPTAQVEDKVRDNYSTSEIADVNAKEPGSRVTDVTEAKSAAATLTTAVGF